MSPRWVVEIDLAGEASQPREYHGPDDNGTQKRLTTYGTSWRGVGATAGEALEFAERGRTAALPDVHECAERLENTLAAAKILKDAHEPLPTVDPDLIDEARRWLGSGVVHSELTKTKRVESGTLLGWIDKLRAALDAP